MSRLARILVVSLLAISLGGCGPRNPTPEKPDQQVRVGENPADGNGRERPHEDHHGERTKDNEEAKFSPGRVFIAHDVNTLADQFGGPQECQFAVNVAEWLAGKRSGKILMMRSNPGRHDLNYKQSVVDALSKAGFEPTITDDFKQKAGDLSKYQIVFVAQKFTGTAFEALDNKELIAYHRGGGNIYLAGGVGPVGVPVEENNWKEFLDSVGFAFNNYSMIPPGVKSEHPIFRGISDIASSGSSVIVNINTDDPRNQILVTANGKGIFAIHDPSASARLTKGIRARD